MPDSAIRSVAVVGGADEKTTLSVAYVSCGRVAVCNNIGKNVPHTGWALAHRRGSTGCVDGEDTARDDRAGTGRGGVRAAMDVAKREAMTRNVDPRRLATALIERFGFEVAAAYAVDRIGELHDGGNLYELSVWREVRKAVTDLTNEADREGEPVDDR